MRTRLAGVAMFLAAFALAFALGAGLGTLILAACGPTTYDYAPAPTTPEEQ